MIEYYKKLGLENLPYVNEEGLVCWEEFKDVPGYEGYQHLKDIFSLVDINTKELK